MLSIVVTTSNSDFKNLRLMLLDKTKKQLAESVSPDTLIMQTLSSVDDLTVQLNMMSKRLREWHGYTLPELSHTIYDHERYVQLIATTPYVELVKQFVQRTPMGAELSKEDYAPIQLFAEKIHSLYLFKQELLTYLESLLSKHAPNVLLLAGTTIAARLLSAAGSLKRLALFPASTVQMLGAEKALFRHLKTGARTPKYGHIFNHPIVQKAGRAQAGKVARALADKLALSAKIDYFKGEMHADSYLKELEKRFLKNKKESNK